MKLVPSGDIAGNGNSGSAVLRACAISAPIPPASQSATPPASDCNRAHADGKRASDGSWSFDLGSFVSYWTASGYSGATLVPATADVPAPVPVAAPAPTWSVAFDASKTSATAEFIPPPPPPGPAEATTSVPAVVLPPQISQFIPQLPIPAPLVQPPLPTAAPIQATVGRVAARPAILVPHVVARRDWVLATLALLAAVVGTLVGSTTRELPGIRPTPRNIARAASVARSRVATPIAILCLIAAFALGSVGTIVFRGDLKCHCTTRGQVCWSCMTGKRRTRTVSRAAPRTCRTDNCRADRFSP